MADGSIHWYRGRHLHRGGGLPAIERRDGSREWYTHGIFRYARGARAQDALVASPAPVLEEVNGTQRWTCDGVLHRDDGPAWIHWSGACKYYRDGVLHRDDGPAWITPRMVVKYYHNGRLDRDDGPAVIYANGSMRWHARGHPGASVVAPLPAPGGGMLAVPMDTPAQAEASARAITGSPHAAQRALERLCMPSS